MVAELMMGLIGDWGHGSDTAADPLYPDKVWIEGQI